MRIAFRVDASCLIGSGHVMRCLVLANYLREEQHTVVFICRNYPDNFIAFLKEQGFIVHALPFFFVDQYLQQGVNDDYAKWLSVSEEQDAKETLESVGVDFDWLVVDHYGLSFQWEKIVSSRVKQLMVIDDLANRPHFCHVLLDQNYYRAFQSRYDGLVSKETKILLGPTYALLKPELAKIRATREACGKFDRYQLRRVLIYMGGADLKNLTLSALEAWLALNLENIQVDVIVGSLNPARELLENFCKKHALFTCHFQPSYYGDLLAKADLAIAAGGSAVYERCFIGLPSLVYAAAANQAELVKDLADYGAHYPLGSLTKNALAEGLQSIEENFFYYQAKMHKLLDNLGCERVASVF